MSMGMQAGPSPVVWKKSTAKGSLMPLVEVLKTVKLVGSCSIEMRTPAAVVQVNFNIWVEGLAQYLPVHLGCSLFIVIKPPSRGNVLRLLTASVYPSKGVGISKMHSQHKCEV